MKTRNNVKPIFISCGNYIDLGTCTERVFNLTNKESRLAIPIKISDLETHRVREEVI